MYYDFALFICSGRKWGGGDLKRGNNIYLTVNWHPLFISFYRKQGNLARKTPSPFSLPFTPQLKYLTNEIIKKNIEIILNIIKYL